MILRGPKVIANIIIGAMDIICEENKQLMGSGGAGMLSLFVYIQ